MLKLRNNCAPCFLSWPMLECTHWSSMLVFSSILHTHKPPSQNTNIININIWIKIADRNEDKKFMSAYVLVYSLPMSFFGSVFLLCAGIAVGLYKSFYVRVGALNWVSKQVNRLDFAIDYTVRICFFSSQQDYFIIYNFCRMFIYNCVCFWWCVNFSLFFSIHFCLKRIWFEHYCTSTSFSFFLIFVI